MSFPTNVQFLSDGDEHPLNTPPTDSVGRAVRPGKEPSSTPGTATSTNATRSSLTGDILTQANHGDLDWSYTTGCVRRWSAQALLAHLYSHAFSVPPRNLNPSSPFVNINIVSQDGDDPEMVSLPQAYRLPLLMVAKYLWDTVLVALSAGREEWMAQRTNAFHIARLCENLFTSARIKSDKTGMEKGWRCLAFDRFLTRFYKHWIHNDPPNNGAFWKLYGAKEYDRDVLRHDWKRWCLRGQNGIKLTDHEISFGVGADQFRKALVFDPETHLWTLNGKTLFFITPDEGPAWSSVSELTDIELEEEEEEVKPSSLVMGNASDPVVPSAPKQTQASLRTESGTPTTRLTLILPRRHDNIHGPGMLSAPVLPRMAPDPTRISTLRRRVSALVSSSSISVPNSATESAAKDLGMKTSPERPSMMPTDLTQLASPSSKRVSSLELETDSRVAKRRRINGLAEKAIATAQMFANQAPLSPSNGTELRRAPFNSVIGTERGTQTEICTGSEANLDRDVPMSDSIRMPTPTIAKRTTSDIGIQAELNSFSSDNSAVRPRQTGNRIMDGCTAEMQDNLSSVIDNLVSSRLLSLTRTLKRSSEPRPTSGSGANGSSPSFCGSSAFPSIRGSSDVDGNFVTALFDELRLLRDEAHAREQRTKEDLRALRYLHNVEVESLRKRIAYLESLPHERVAREYEHGSGRAAAAAGYSYSGGQTDYNGSDNRATMPPRFGDKYNHVRDSNPGSSFGPQPSRSPDRPVPGPSNGNGFSGRHFPMTRSGNDAEEDSPLPSKAQRKSHIMAFSRSLVTG